MTIEARQTIAASSEKGPSPVLQSTGPDGAIVPGRHLRYCKVFSLGVFVREYANQGDEKVK